MRHFIIATDTRTGRKRIYGQSVRERYRIERMLSEKLPHAFLTYAIESFPTVTAASIAIAAHNEPLPLSWNVKKDLQ